MAERLALFRPCIDLHNGQVKQIVGGTLSDGNPDVLKTNFVAKYVFSFFLYPGFYHTARSRSAAYYAHLYKQNNLEGGHIIKLRPGNDVAALEAIKAWPGSTMLLISHAEFVQWDSQTLYKLEGA